MDKHMEGRATGLQLDKSQRLQNKMEVKQQDKMVDRQADI